MLLLIEPNDFTDPLRPSNPGDPYIALVDPAGVTPLKVTQIPTTGALITQTGTPAPPDPLVTKISHLHLARFADTKLSLSYKSDGQAECTVNFLEAPDEYTAPQPDLPEPAFLYIFTEQMPVPLVTRFTSYEDSIALTSGAYFGGPYYGVYAPAPFSHKNMNEGNRLDEEKIDLTSWDFDLATNPLRKVLDYALEGTLHLDVLEVDRNNLDAGADLVFSGDYSALKPKGKDWTATFLEFGQFFRRQVSRFYYGRICAVPVYSPKCGVNKAAYLTDGTLFAFAADGSYIDVAAIAGHTDPASKAADYFALGFFQLNVANTNFEQRNITHTAIVGSRLRLYFQRPLRKSALNQTVNIYPGCNGSVDMCISRFNNLLNFRGHPYVPDKNPSANIGEVSNATSGGKKG